MSDPMTNHRRARMLLALLLTSVLVAAAFATPAAQAAPAAPTGLSAYAQNGRVQLSWDAVPGATSYTLVRGTSAAALTTTVVTGLTTTSYVNTTATNNTTWFYAIRAVDGTGASVNSSVVSAAPKAPTCTTGNAVVIENCFPGSTAWKVPQAYDPSQGGIEGFASKTSITAGQSVDLKVNAATGVPYHIEVWRTGWYGGAQGRLVSSDVGLSGSTQPACTVEFSTGLRDCANWSPTSRLTTTTGWTSGVYLLKLVRDDNAASNYILLTVRDDSRASALLYSVPVTTYQAYNAWGGRSLYDWNSDGQPTVSGTSRAVKVSFDRPYEETVTRSHDFYIRGDVATVGWLEREGYDVSYADSIGLKQSLPFINQHKTIMLGTHDEYWSAEMRSTLTAARDAGVNLAFMGSNNVYWKVRFEASPTTGDADRTLVCYKSTQSGGPDPSGIHTGTWRDPAGANQPENALAGAMYVGDNDAVNFPYMVTATQGKDRAWRYTSLPDVESGTTEIGSELVGWEWDRRVNNGFEPAGLRQLSASPVSGNILQDAGRVYANGSEEQTSTIYKAASGATVFSAATNHWSRALGNDVADVGELEPVLQQATANILADMATLPTTPSGITVDATGPLVISSRTPASGATGVSPTTTVRVTFDRPVDPDTVTSGQLTLTRTSTGAAVTGSTSYDSATKTATFTPSAPLASNTGYTARVNTGIKGWNGQGLTAVSSWAFTSGSSGAPVVASRTPASGAVGVAPGSTVTATFDRAVDPTTVTSSSFTLSSPSGAVTGTVTYNAATLTATFTPSSALSLQTQYTPTLTTAIKGSDGTPMTAAVSWTFTTQVSFSVTSRTPAALATGVSPGAAVRATFSAPVDATTLTASSFTLTRQGGLQVPGTITYDGATRTATLTPSTALSLAATYVVNLSTAVKATDGTSLTPAVSWTFSTALTTPPAPTVTTVSPSSGATGVALTSAVTAVFSTSLDTSSVTTQSATLTPAGGAAVAATVTYTGATSTVTITPAAQLAPGVVYTARLTTGIRSAAGTPLASDVTWTFTTAACPCSMMPAVTPTSTGNPVSDGRGAGTWTYELGVRFTVDQTMNLTALRYWRDPAETGAHVGRLWTSSGTQLAQVTYSGGTASGWQQQALASPVTLSPGQTYVASVGLNSAFVTTPAGLATSLGSGPLHSVADGANGVYGAAAGTFPTGSWNSSNYFVDVVVASPVAAPHVPQVTSTSPASGAAGVNPNTTVSATFGVPLDPSTVDGSSVTLTRSGGAQVSATVTYDDATKTVRLTPSAALDLGTAYTARLATTIKSDDGTALPAAYSWTFTTSAGGAPQVTAISPADAATGVTPLVKATATFDIAMSASTINASTFTLTGPGGPVSASVTYDAPTRTATLTPSSTLAASSAYTLRVTTGVQSSTGTAMSADRVWTLTTSACSCRLYTAGATPASTGLSTVDGRTGAGPFTYELGTKVTVNQPARLEAISFYKSPGETGTHVGRLWSSTGTLLGTVTFAGETASGWQTQTLTTPVNLTSGATYVVSVNANAFFVMTRSGLATAITSGPLSSVADGANGVFGAAAGTFPTSSWSSSSYLVDAVVR